MIEKHVHELTVQHKDGQIRKLYYCQDDDRLDQIDLNHCPTVASVTRTAEEVEGHPCEYCGYETGNHPSIVAQWNELPKGNTFKLMRGNIKVGEQIILRVMNAEGPGLEEPVTITKRKEVGADWEYTFSRQGHQMELF